jgi:hypothetical protein
MHAYKHIHNGDRHNKAIAGPGSRLSIPGEAARRSGSRINVPEEAGQVPDKGKEKEAG